MTKIGINGFGRIGRCVARAILADPSSDLEIVGGHERHVGVELPLPPDVLGSRQTVLPGEVSVAGEGAVLSLDASRHVVGHGVVPAGYGEGGARARPRLEQPGDEIDLEHFPRTDVLPEERAQLVGSLGGPSEAGMRLVPVRRIAREALLDVEVPAGLPRRPPLGEDLDDAVGRLRAVQRGRRRAFQDLDALDGGRVDVVEARGGAAAPADVTAEAAAVVDADAVDVDDGLVGLGEAARSTDTDAGALADEPAGGQAHHARLAPEQGFRHGRDGSPLQGATIDGRDGVAELPALGGHPGAGDHDLVEGDGG